MVTIHPEGKITDRRYLYKGVTDLFGSIDRDSELLPENKTLLKRFIHDARLGKTIQKGAKKKVGALRQVKYLQDLKKLDRYFKKPLDQITQEEMEHFIIDLEEGRLMSNRGTPFTVETQVCMKKIIIKFYKWLNGGKVAPDMVSWIDTSFTVKDYKAISEQQMQEILLKLYGLTSDKVVRDRAIICFLFDSGVRADELLNIRLSHLTVDKDNYMVRIEFSKTKARTIAIPMCKKYIDDWLAIHPARNNLQAQLFPLQYNALCNIVHRAGELINWKLTPHSLRHSSITYYARHLSRYQLCYRYGWAMSSRQPDRYIDKEGLGQEKVTEVVEARNFQTVNEENKKLSQRLALMEEQMLRLMKADREQLMKIVEYCRQN